VDVHLTADSVIAVLHDEDVGRVTVDGTGLISTLTWAQARALTLKNQGGQIPSLVEVRGFVRNCDPAASRAVCAWKLTCCTRRGWVYSLLVLSLLLRLLLWLPFASDLSLRRSHTWREREREREREGRVVVGD
jgi:hypothetical protein